MSKSQKNDLATYDANLQDEEPKIIKNQHYDVIEDCSSEGSEIPSEKEQSSESKDIERSPMSIMKEGANNENEFNPYQYNPQEYKFLQVGSEVRDLFAYITRFTPQSIELKIKMKPLIPDYIPSVGEVDAFLKPPRPDNIPEKLGLTLMDEPCLNQTSNKWRIPNPRPPQYPSTKIVHSIENTENKPKEIVSWIQMCNEINEKKSPPQVLYSKSFPDIETLMQVWPTEIEDALQNIRLPNEEIDLSLKEYCQIACALMDIPIHNENNSKQERNLIESMHVFFMLYTDFKHTGCVFFKNMIERPVF